MPGDSTPNIRGTESREGHGGQAAVGELIPKTTTRKCRRGESLHHYRRFPPRKANPGAAGLHQKQGVGVELWINLEVQPWDEGDWSTLALGNNKKVHIPCEEALHGA